MIRSVKNLKGFTIGASNGEIGKVKDAYFDDSEWVVRYLVVDTGTWLSGRKVLVSPLFITGVNWDAAAVDVTLSREQVKDSPDIDFDKPVSRQQEAEYYNYYRAAGYWGGPFLWGRFPHPAAARRLVTDVVDEEGHKHLRRGDRNVEDSHLRSANEVIGYHIEARDGNIGHVEDFLFDEETWLVESLLVDTRNWLPGRHVMVPSDWIERVDWLERIAGVSVDRATIQEQPEYPDELVAGGNLGEMSGSRRDAASARRNPP